MGTINASLVESGDVVHSGFRSSKGAYSQNQIYIVANAFLQAVIDSGEYTQNNLRFVMDPNSRVNWPVPGSPYCLVYFGEMTALPECYGGGRYVKTWSSIVFVELDFTNVLDVPYNDLSALTNPDSSIGAYSKAHRIINAIEQAFLLNPYGGLVLRELPVARSISPATRTHGNYSNTSITLRFEISWQEELDLPFQGEATLFGYVTEAGDSVTGMMAPVHNAVFVGASLTDGADIASGLAASSSGQQTAGSFGLMGML